MWTNQLFLPNTAGREEGLCLSMREPQSCERYGSCAERGACYRVEMGSLAFHAYQRYF